MKFKFLILNLLKSLYVNKRQSLLTIGSLSIGIVSVLLVLALGNGVKCAISQQIESVTGGSNVFKVNYFPNAKEGGITENDQQRISTIPGVLKAQLTTNPAIKNLMVTNPTSNKEDHFNYDQLSQHYYQNGQQLKLLSGQTLAQIQKADKYSIALKDTTAQKLCHSTDIVGRVMSIEGSNYLVTAIYQGVEETPDILVSQQAFLNLNDYQPMFNQIKVFYRNHDQPQVQKAVTDYLNNNGDDHYAGSYQVEDVHQVVEQINKTTSLATNLVAGVAGISLIVAGFGVMSATYSSIAERKSEIGLRRAFGATQQNIRNQFILEGILMTIIAALISIILVLILSLILGNTMGIRLIIKANNVLIAILIPTAIALLFTYFPAVTASKKNLVALLR